MAGPEAVFYRWLAEKFKDFSVDQWDRIESTTTKAIPDIDLCHKGICTKLELKAEMGNQVKLKPEQRNWIMKRVRSGGRVFILVKRTTAKLNQIELFDGIYADKLFNKEPVTPTVTAVKNGTGYCKQSMNKMLKVITGEG